MDFKLTPAQITDQSQALSFLQSAAKSLAKKGVDQWQYWLNPPKDELAWLEDGLRNGDYYFIQLNSDEIAGMVRIQTEDHLYWGEKADQAWYIHSLIVEEKWAGLQLGTNVLEKIELDAIESNQDFLRLDCLASNEKLCSYYQNQGFEKVGQVDLPLSTCNLYEKKIGASN
ncbi:GNAT family N-acetyltransferase [bacterium SCSIO 12741]|nr:GNAT family N-acetyltransferase [bacterium SCSIO 12741]